MTRKLVISDIHGHREQLLKLLDCSGFHPSSDQLVLLGDYINKGPDSKGTLQTIKRLYFLGAIVLRGNHEQQIMENTDFKNNNNNQDSNLTFIQSMPLWYEDENFVYAHAGVRPLTSMENQSSHDLISIRLPFITSEWPLKKRVVFGHTPAFRLGAKLGDIWVRKDKIGVDTGAAHNAYLSLIDLTNEIIYRISTAELLAPVEITRFPDSLDERDIF